MSYQLLEGDQVRVNKKDQRIRINNQMHYPYNLLGKIVSTFYSNNKYIEKTSTAVIIGPNLILTCAHNIFLKKQNKKATQIKFYPFYQQKDKQLRSIYITQFFISPSYQHSNDKNYSDLALLKLSENNIIDKKIDRYPIFKWDYQLKFCSNDIMIVGYCLQDQQKHNIQCWQNNKLSYCIGKPKDQDRHFLYYHFPTDEGYGGAPIFYRSNEDQQYQIVGIHKGKFSQFKQGILFSDFINSKTILSELIQTSKLQTSLSDIYNPTQKYILSENIHLRNEMKKAVQLIKVVHKQNQNSKKKCEKLRQQNQALKKRIQQLTQQHNKMIMDLKKQIKQLKIYHRQINNQNENKKNKIQSNNSNKNKETFSQQFKKIIILNSAINSNKITNQFRQFFNLTHMFIQKLEKQNQLKVNKLKQMINKFKFDTNFLQTSYKIAKFYINIKQEKSLQRYQNKILKVLEPQKINQLKNILQKTQCLEFIQSFQYSPKQNNLKIKDLKSQYLGKFKNLKSLNLSSNLIQQLTNLQVLQNLSLLNVSSNKIKAIDQFAKADYPNLSSINLSNNKIKQLPILNIQNLQILDFSNNQIERIKTQSFQKCQNLQKINLSNNKITTLPKLILLKLINLNLKQNPIENIESFIQSQIKQQFQLLLTCTSMQDYQSFSNQLKQGRFKSKVYINLKKNKQSIPQKEKMSLQSKQSN